MSALPNIWGAVNTWDLTPYVLGSDIPAGGGNGGALFYDSLDLPADANKLYRFEEVETVQEPATISIDLSTTVATVSSNGTPGVYSYKFRAFEKDGENPEVDLGVITAYFVFGTFDGLIDDSVANINITPIDETIVAAVTITDTVANINISAITETIVVPEPITPAKTVNVTVSRKPISKVINVRSQSG